MTHISPVPGSQVSCVTQPSTKVEDGSKKSYAVSALFRSFQESIRGWVTKKVVMPAETPVVLQQHFLNVPPIDFQDVDYSLKDWVAPLSSDLELAIVAQETLGQREQTAREVDLRAGLSLKSVEFGSIGIPNLGSSCYINSTLQCLFSFKIVREKIAHLTPDIQKAPVTYALKTIFQQLTQKSITRDPIYALKEALNHPDYSGNEQQDSMMFYQDLIHKLSEENKTENIEQLFKGCQISIIECDTKHHQSISAPTFFSCFPLRLSPTKEFLISVQDLYDKAIEPSLLQGDNQARCLGCNKRFVDASQKLSLLPDSLPPVLALQLKRFQTTSRGSVKDPMAIALDDQIFVEKIPYRLKSVSFHMGGSSVDSGHYTAAVRADGKWAYYNDNSPPTFYNDISKTDAYGLFYEKE